MPDLWAFYYHNYTVEKVKCWRLDKNNIKLEYENYSPTCVSNTIFNIRKENMCKSELDALLELSDYIKDQYDELNKAREAVSCRIAELRDGEGE